MKPWIVQCCACLCLLSLAGCGASGAIALYRVESFVATAEREIGATARETRDAIASAARVAE